MLTKGSHFRIPVKRGRNVKVINSQIRKIVRVILTIIPFSFPTARQSVPCRSWDCLTSVYFSIETVLFSPTASIMCEGEGHKAGITMDLPWRDVTWIWIAIPAERNAMGLEALGRYVKPKLANVKVSRQGPSSLFKSNQSELEESEPMSRHGFLCVLNHLNCSQTSQIVYLSNSWWMTEHWWRHYANTPPPQNLL